ncbi:hypothetical protein ACWDZ8_11755, partial [Streptomyces sp. NPDC003233]
ATEDDAAFLASLGLRTIFDFRNAADQKLEGPAQGLLDQLAASPSAAERSAGYTTYVPGGLTVRGPGHGDPEDALRLSTAPSRLTSYALAQIVCTLSDSAATEDDGSVILGGPDTGPLRRYDCTDDVRDRPGSAEPPSSEVAGR